MKRTNIYTLNFIKFMMFTMMFLVICSVASARVPDKLKWKVGSKPDYKIQCIKGELFTPQTMRGRYVVMHFWASWNKGSVESIRYLRTVWPDFKEHNIKLVSIALDHSYKKVRQIVGKEKVEWPV
ncbi:MAG: redoxin domain-containing protein, partial [Pseudomonadales bacterium]|nr:redoxin domain-containing protein [Pseudomonadales bacterium]